MKPASLLIVILSLLAFLPTSHAQTFVNAAALGNNDGTSWTDAYVTLHDALENYSAGDEIWVAAGTYLPGSPTAWPGDSTNLFYIDKDVRLYGGFNGTESVRAERDPANNLTVLSGDLNGDDIDDNFSTNRAENAYTVVFVDTVVTAATFIDGFTIRNGHSAGSLLVLHESIGGGLLAWGSPQVNDCRFLQNYALAGGGLYFRGRASAEGAASNCVFEDNLVIEAGGGMAIVTMDSSKTVSVTNCQFSRSTSRNLGGGVAVGASTVKLTHCTFADNESDSEGGGLYITVFPDMGNKYRIETDSCSFTGNTSGTGGGAHYVCDGLGENDVVFTCCTFTGNRSITTESVQFPAGGALGLSYGGGTVASLDSIRVLNCTFEDNLGEYRGGGVTILNRGGTDNYLEFRECVLSRNRTTRGEGGGLFLRNYGGEETEINFIDCDFMENSANRGGGFYYLSDVGNDNDLHFSGCDFDDNRARTTPAPGSPDGGALCFQYTQGNLTRDTIRLTDCKLEDNQADRFGGGLAFFNDQGVSNHLEINDCDIFNNAAGVSSEGGGIIVFEGARTSSVLVSNTHFRGNTAEEIQGFLIVRPSDENTLPIRHVELLNCLFTDHNPISGSGYVTAAQNAEYILTNCTIANNDCSAIGLLASNFATKLTLRNNILQSGEFPDLVILRGDASSSVESLGGNLIGSNALDEYTMSSDQTGADPLFADGSYQLSPNSPAVDAGILPDEPVDFDFAGNDRIQGGCIDIGAFESAHDAGRACLLSTNPEVLAHPGALSVTPNPTTNRSQLSIDNDWRGVLSIRLVSPLGREVYTAEYLKIDRLAAVHLPLDNLPSGVYRVLVSNGRAVAVSSIVKIR